jgi:hypothetical protein
MYRSPHARSVIDQDLLDLTLSARRGIVDLHGIELALEELQGLRRCRQQASVEDDLSAAADNLSVNITEAAAAISKFKAALEAIARREYTTAALLLERNVC